MTEIIAWKNQRKGTILEYRGKMALVRWQKCYGSQARWLDPQSPGSRGYGMGHEIVEIPEHESWVNTQDPTFTIEKQKSIFDLAKENLEGLLPGQERIIWGEPDKDYIALRREKNRQVIKLTFPRRGVQARFAAWKKQYTQAGGGAWEVEMTEEGYKNFVKKCKND
ncbi:MAG: hypothetical protein GF334_00235 [Candidatus Altiarchaeales archaeon]|nr:hypothetical protein [Candidatus Altiarchaeales archaeon]